MLLLLASPETHCNISRSGQDDCHDGTQHPVLAWHLSHNCIVKVKSKDSPCCHANKVMQAAVLEALPYTMPVEAHGDSAVHDKDLDPQ